MSDHMKTKFAKTNHKLTTFKKPHPTNLPYTTSTLVTPPLTSKDFYHYITPYIKYYTLQEGNNTDLFVITPTNKIAIHGFTDPIIDIQIFRFKNSIDSMNYGLLVVTKNQMIIYGIEIVDNEFALVNINITVYVGDDIEKVVISDGNIIFCTKNDLYQFFYMSGFFNTSYIYRYKGIKDYFISFFTSENNSIKDICINRDYAAVLREKCIEVYRVTDSLKLYKRLETGSAIAIYFYSDNIFFTVDSFGNRVFYNENAKILDVASPQSFTFYDGNTCVSSDGDTLLIVKNKKNEKNSIVMVVTQNEYYKQSEPNKENYQTFTINDEIECIKVFDRHIIMKSQEYTHKLTITPPGQYFLKCKHLELTALHKLYGTNDFLLHYLSLIEEGFDVSKLDFLFLKADDYDFIYEYAYKRLLVLNDGNSMINGNQANKKNLLNSRNLKINAKDQCEMYSEAFLSPCSDDYIIKLCRTINAFKAVYAKLRKYRKDNFKEVIDDLKALIDTLKFVKIINERRIDISCDFESLLFSKDYRKNILEELSASLPYDKLNQIVTETLKDYFPIEEIFFRKGMENVKKKRRDTLYESINDFKECNNVEEIIRIYDENRFYTGSVTMIKDRMFGRSEIDDIKRRRIEGTNSGSNIGKVTKALRNSVKCKGAFEKALDDYREDFVFCLLEAVLKNVLQGVESKERCTCCDRDSWKLDFSSSLALARIKSPYLEKFLESKFENSNDEEEYNLYWKYYILNNNKDKAREILMKIIKEKPITLEKRIKFLERSVVLFQSNEIRMMLQVAEIQRELSKSMPECLSLKIRYYDQNELFNDWLSSNNPFLALKLLQVCKCNDIETKKELLTDLFDGDYEEAIEKVSFYSELNKKGWIEIELIGDIIIGKLEMVQKTSLMHVLKSFNYDEIDIKRYMEKRLKDSVFGNPEQKRRILREYKEYYGYCEKTMEFENYCYKNYGVKV